MENSRIYVALATFLGVIFIFVLYLETDKALKVNGTVRDLEEQIEYMRKSQSNVADGIRQVKTQLKAAEQECLPLEEKWRAIREEDAKRLAAQTGINEETAAIDKELALAKASLATLLARKNQAKYAEFTPTRSRSYTDVTIKTVTPGGINFVHSGGMAKFSPDQITPEVAREFHLDKQLELTKIQNIFADISGIKDPVIAAASATEAEVRPIPVAAPATDNTGINAPMSRDKADLVAKCSVLDARIANLTSQRDIELETAQSKDSRIHRSRIVASTGNVNRERAKKIEVQIDSLRRAKIELEYKINQMK